MKKITIATAILIAGTVFVSAETNAQEQKPRAMMRRGVAQQNVASTTRVMTPQGGEGREGVRVEGMMPIITTGDDATDAQIKSLAVEMEAKVKLIRDEYQTKIKAILDTRKLTNGTSTRPMMPKNEDDNRQKVGSSTEGNNSPRERRFGEVRGVNIEGVGQAVGQDVSSRMMNFFRGMFGGR